MNPASVGSTATQITPEVKQTLDLEMKSSKLGDISLNTYCLTLLTHNVFVCNRLYTIESDYLKGAFFITVAAGSVLIGGLVGLAAVILTGVIFAVCKDYFEYPLLRIVASGNLKLFNKVLEYYPNDFPYYDIFDTEGKSILNYVFDVTVPGDGDTSNLKNEILENILTHLPPNTQDPDGNTVLHYMLRNLQDYNPSMLPEFDLNWDPKICNNEGLPPICEVPPEKWSIGLIEKLYGKEYDIIDTAGKSLLETVFNITSADDGDTSNLKNKILEYILTHLPPNTQDPDGNTVLHYMLRNLQDYDPSKLPQFDPSWDPRICNSNGFPPIYEVPVEKWTVELINKLYGKSDNPFQNKYESGLRSPFNGERMLLYDAGRACPNDEVFEHLLSRAHHQYDQSSICASILSDVSEQLLKKADHVYVPSILCESILSGPNYMRYLTFFRDVNHPKEQRSKEISEREKNINFNLAAIGLSTPKSLATPEKEGVNFLNLFIECVNKDKNRDIHKIQEEFRQKGLKLPKELLDFLPRTGDGTETLSKKLGEEFKQAAGGSPITDRTPAAAETPETPASAEPSIQQKTPTCFSSK